MSPENWQRVKTLLDACLELPSPERLAYLESACDDPAIRSEVVSLLEAHEDSTTFLEELPPLDQKAAIAFQPNIMAGQKVGPYYLIEELGRGGMGTVYRAVRADYEFVLVVALKIVSRGMDTEMVLRRFRNERQILAGLEHAYIARLLDGGTTETGLPYFVMEYVEGVPILQYCDAHKLGVAERIELFRKVCDAVSYAHRNLIVHRDIKPGNILVTPDGTPKLLDFGIAGIVAGAPEEEEEGGGSPAAHGDAGVREPRADSRQAGGNDERCLLAGRYSVRAADRTQPIPAAEGQPRRRGTGEGDLRPGTDARRAW